MAYKASCETCIRAYMTCCRKGLHVIPTSAGLNLQDKFSRELHKFMLIAILSFRGQMHEENPFSPKKILLHKMNLYCALRAHKSADRIATYCITKEWSL